MKKFIKTSVYILLSILYLPTYSMQLASRASGKYGGEYAKKIISKCFTATHWGISAGPFIQQGLGKLGLSIFDKDICDLMSAHDSGIAGYETDVDGNKKPIYRNKYLGSADSSIQQFADEQAKKIGLEKMPSVRTWESSVSPLSAVNNVILIDNRYDAELKLAIKTNDLKKQNEVAGILQHEDTHIKYQDTLTHGAECLVTPLLTHQLTKTAIQFMPFAQRIAPFWLQQSLKLLSGVSKYGLNSAILNASSRHKEQRADDGICDDIEILQAVSDSFSRMEKEHVSSENDFKETFPKLNYYLFASHPTISDRIEKFNKRAELLKHKNPS